MTTPVLIDTATAGAASGSTLTIAVPAGTTEGDILVALVRGQGISTGTTQASCPGWSPRHAQGTDDRVHMILTHQVSATPEPASYTFATNGSSGRIVGAIQLWRGVDPVNPVAGSHGYTKLSGTTQTLTSWPVDSAADDLVAIGLWSDERTSGQSHVPTSTPSGWATGINVQSTLDDTTSGSRTSIWSGYAASTGVTTIPDATVVMPSGVTSPNASAIALRGTGATPPPATLPFRSVAHFLASPGATSAWRLGGGPYPQLSEYAADHSIGRGYKALEFSCGWTSDNVPFGLGVQYLDSVAGVSGNVDPTTMTWATLSATYVNRSNPVAPGVYQPFYRLADALAKYAADYIMLVDPKYGFDTIAKIDAMLDLCDANGGPSRIIIKFDSTTSSTVLTTRAHARGYQCMGFWGTDQTTLAAQQGNWDILGVDRAAPQATFDAAKSYGKPVWAAVTASQAEYDTALARGAGFQNVAAVNLVTPVGGAATSQPWDAVYVGATLADAVYVGAEKVWP